MRQNHKLYEKLILANKKKFPDPNLFCVLAIYFCVTKQYRRHTQDVFKSIQFFLISLHSENCYTCLAFFVSVIVDMFLLELFELARAIVYFS